MFEKWLVNHRVLVHWSIPVFFGVLGVGTAFFVFWLEHATDNKPLIFLLTLSVPSSIALVVLCELALAWFYDYWLTGKTKGLTIRTFTDAREFARFRRDILRSIRPGEVENPIYCTSHCNLFAKPDGRANVRDEVRAINKECFQHLARIALEPGSRGGLCLLLHDEGEYEDLMHELSNQIEIFTRIAAEKDRDWNWGQFDVRRLLQPSMKDYCVVNDHVFKTIRKSEESNRETQYVYIQNSDIANTYRDWLADLFEYGEGRETERDEIRDRVNLIKDDLQLEQR